MNNIYIITEDEKNFLSQVLTHVNAYNEAGEDTGGVSARGFIDLLQPVPDEELKNELKARGYSTDNLWHNNDVQTVLDSVNEEEETNFVFTEEEKENILKIVLDDLSAVNSDIEREVRAEIEKKEKSKVYVNVQIDAYGEKVFFLGDWWNIEEDQEGNKYFIVSRAGSAFVLYITDKEIQ